MGRISAAEVFLAANRRTGARARTPRRNGLLTVSALALVCVAWGLCTPVASAAPTPIAAYAFDEGSGSTAHGYVGGHTGGNYDGVIEGATWTTSGKYGSALEFDGTNDLVSITDANDLDLTGPFTIEAWVRPDLLGRPVLSKGTVGNPGSGTGYKLATIESGGVNGLPSGYISSSNTAVRVDGASPIPVKTWTHLGFTSDGTTLKMYVNGQLTGSKALTITPAATTAKLEIGRSFYGGFFDGTIDEVRIYNLALSQSQIEADRNSPIRDPHDTRRDGAAYNANFDLDGVDDYRVDADMAELHRGPWSQQNPAGNLVHHVDCTNPNPWFELLDQYEPPSQEDPNWEPDELLNETFDPTYGPYGCLDNGAGTSDPTGSAGGGRAVEIDGSSGLGGVAPGTRVWGVRSITGSILFGKYVDPATFLTVAATGLGPVSSPAFPVSCKQSELSAGLDDRSFKLVFSEPQYGECSAPQGSAAVRMNSCRYIVRAENVGPPYRAALKIACTEAGDKVEVDISNGKEVICTEKFAGQERLSQIELANVGAKAEREVEVTAEVQDLEYERSGLCVKAPEVRKDGRFGGETILTAATPAAQQRGVYIAGEEAPIENEELQPQFYGEVGYLPEMGVAHVIAGLDWVTAHANEVDIAYLQIGCARQSYTYHGYEGPYCDEFDTAIKEAVARAVDAGVVVVAAAGNEGQDTSAAAPQNVPDVLNVSAVRDWDGVPGGKAQAGAGENACAAKDDELLDQPENWTPAESDFGLLVDVAETAGCGDTGGTSLKAAGAAAALASQCPPDDRAGVEYIVDTLMAEGDTGEIAEGGWKDTSGDGWKEPLLNLADEEVFDPVLKDTKTGVRNHEPDPDCPWRSAQAESDVDSDGRADLVAAGAASKGAELFAGTYEGPEEAPAHNGYETGSPTVSLKGLLDPALLDGAGEYAIDTADVNGDRRADLVTVGAAEGDAFVHLGKADGSFGGAIKALDTTKPAMLGGSHEPIAVADVNGDRRADYVFESHNGNQIYTALGQSNGTFATAIGSVTGAVDPALRDGKGSYFLDVIDVTGEELDKPEANPIDYNAKHSYADLVASNTNGTVYVYPGKSNGTFGGAVEAAKVNSNLDDGAGEEIVGLGDVDRDRRADLLTLNGETLKLRRASANGSFKEALTAYTGKVNSSLLDGKGQELIGLQDYSRDGLADLVSVTDTGGVLTWRARRDFTFAAPVTQAGSLLSLRNSATGHEFAAEKPLPRRLPCTAAGCRWPVGFYLAGAQSGQESAQPRFEGESYPLTVAGGGISLTANGIAFSCKQSSLRSTLTGTTKQLTLDAEHAECTGTAGETSSAATITMHTCRYTLSVDNAGPPYVGKFGVTCTTGGDTIDFATSLCTIKVGAQSGIAGASLANVGAAALRGVSLVANAKTVAWKSSGTCGTASGSTGKLKGEPTLIGHG